MIWLGYYGFVMIIAALNSKMLGATIVAAIGLTMVYPDATWLAVLLSLFLLLTCLLLLAISPVAAASSQQATATPTFIPLFPTSTQVDSFNLNCPAALPVGWGTVTPGLLWNSSCGHCQQTLMAPSSTPVPSVTPGGPTLTPTVTVTPSPTPEPPQGITAYISNVYGANLDGSNNGIDNVLQTDIYGISGSITQTYTGGAWPNYGIYVEITGLEEQMTILWEMNGESYFDYFYAIGQAGFTGLPTYPTNSFLSNGQYYRTGQLNWNEQPAGTYTIILGRFRGNPVNGSITNHAVGFRILEINGQSVSLATPEPSPTPVVVDYCGEVNGVAALPFELGISLPEFGIGASSCYGITEIVLPTSIINFFPGIDIDDVTIPGIQLCFTEISFGTLDLFGVTVNLDSIANLLAAALIIRWLLRS